MLLYTIYLYNYKGKNVSLKKSLFIVVRVPDGYFS